jgi:hypothetical protein
MHRTCVRTGTAHRFVLEGQRERAAASTSSQHRQSMPMRRHTCLLVSWWAISERELIYITICNPLSLSLVDGVRHKLITWCCYCTLNYSIYSPRDLRIYNEAMMLWRENLSVIRALAESDPGLFFVWTWVLYECMYMQCVLRILPVVVGKQRSCTVAGSQEHMFSFLWPVIDFFIYI